MMSLRPQLCGVARWLLPKARRAVDACCTVRPSIKHGSVLHFHAIQLLVTACRARNRAIKEENEKRAKGEDIVFVSDTTVAVVLCCRFSSARTRMTSNCKKPAHNQVL